MLTARQQEIWQFLVEYTDGHGYPPTVREIGDAVGLASPSTVHAHLANLERAGLRRVAPDEADALEVRQMRMHRGRRRQAHLLADLADRRRIAVVVDVRDEELPDLLLACSEWGVGRHGVASWGAR